MLAAPSCRRSWSQSRARHASEGDDADGQHRFRVPQIHFGVLGACMPVFETQHVPRVQCSVSLHAASRAALLTVQCCSLLRYHTTALIGNHDHNQSSHLLRNPQVVSCCRELPPQCTVCGLERKLALMPLLSNVVSDRGHTKSQMDEAGSPHDCCHDNAKPLVMNILVPAICMPHAATSSSCTHSAPLRAVLVLVEALPVSDCMLCRTVC